MILLAPDILRRGISIPSFPSPWTNKVVFSLFVAEASAFVIPPEYTYCVIMKKIAAGAFIRFVYSINKVTFASAERMFSVLIVRLTRSKNTDCLPLTVRLAEIVISGCMRRQATPERGMGRFQPDMWRGDGFAVAATGPGHRPEVHRPCRRSRGIRPRLSVPYNQKQGGKLMVKATQPSPQRPSANGTDGSGALSRGAQAASAPRAL